MTVTEPSVQFPKKRMGRPKGSKNKPKDWRDSPAIMSAPPEIEALANKTAADIERIAKQLQPVHETPDQKRARLLAELAELAPQSSAPVGPNYWTMTHNTLKALCVSKSIIDRTGTKEGMVGALQAEDMKAGLQPHPRENEQALSGLRPSNTPVHAEPQNRDSMRIIDADGNQYAMVYRIGRNVNGTPVIMDMEGNARKIVAALNEGRI